jgi:hypothetical protein
MTGLALEISTGLVLERDKLSKRRAKSRNLILIKKLRDKRERFDAPEMTKTNLYYDIQINEIGDVHVLRSKEYSTQTL